MICGSARIAKHAVSFQIFDLLANRSELVLREDGHGVVQVVGLTERVADTAAQVLGSVSQAQQLRRTTSTQVTIAKHAMHLLA